MGRASPARDATTSRRRPGDVQDPLPGVLGRCPGRRQRGQYPPRRRSDSVARRAVRLCVATAALGIDLSHFALLAMVKAMIGLITPSNGVLPVAISAVAGTPLRDIIGKVWEVLGALIRFPDLVLWLPRQMGGGG